MNAAKNSGINESKFQELIAFTKEALQRQHVPGVAMGLFVDGQEYTAGLGITSIENPLPVTPETLFMIGSITKTYTATVLLRLIEQGFLNLDDTVRNFLPDFQVQDHDAAEGATIRHLLNHTGGWLGDYTFVSGAGDDNLEKYVASLADLEQFTPIGEIFTYNNTSFNIAGRIIEVVTGKTFEEAVRELVLEPLEMKNSTFSLGEVMLQRFVVGHVWQEEKQQTVIARPWGFERCENPAGGLVSNVNDQLRFARFHMGDGRTPGGELLLKPDTVALMQTPEVKGDMTWMGLNWFIWDIDGVRFFEHGGSTNGQQADLWFTRDKGLALVVLTNQDLGYLLHTEITSWVREHYLGVIEKEPVPIPLSEEVLAEYTAGFKTSWGDVFEFRSHEGGLMMTHIQAEESELDEIRGDAFPPMRTSCIEPDRFIFDDPPFKGWKFDFLRGKDGKVAWLRFSGRVMARQDIYSERGDKP